MKKYLLQQAVFCLLGTFFAVPLFAQGDSRAPVVAGQFYPANPAQLTKDIESRLQKVQAGRINGEIVGLVVPHAGYQYSANVAASAYKQVAGKKVDVVVILAPSHRDRFRGATIYPGAAYDTPLGSAAIHRSVAEQLVADCKAITFSEYGHRAEHSLEVQVPFVQTLFPAASIVPIVIGVVDWPACQSMSVSLARALKNQKALIIASSDLYHGESYDQCQKSCGETLAAMTALDPKNLFHGLMSERYLACGGVPVVVMQLAAHKLGATAALVLDRTNSNDVTGTQGGYVVGYGAVAVYRNATKENNSSRIKFEKLDVQDQIDLIKMARASIESFLKFKTIPAFEPATALQREKRGVFVTITKNGYVRGCIGHHESTVPLYQLVPRMAISAAFEDRRFPSLQDSELDQIKIKISVYSSNVYKIDSLDEFEMGVHGIIMRKGQRGATYLPEVPLEAGWTTVEQEMASLCQKAGLPNDAWKNGADFWVYETQVFDESILTKMK